MIIFFCFLLTIAIIVIVCMHFAENNSTSNAHTITKSPEQKYPVSKEQMSIFEKNWSLAEFRKEFGELKEVKTKQDNWGVSYKICIFSKGFYGTPTRVRFSSSLGFLSKAEILQREAELMVGLSKEKHNYVLYNNKITKYELSNWQTVDLLEEINTDILYIEDTTSKVEDNPTKRREENIGKKETPNTSLKNEDSDNSSVSDNVKATTKKEAEVNHIKDTEKIIKDALTVEQKQALLGLALRLCDDYCISDYRNQVNEIIQNYKTSLGLNNMQLTYTSYKIAWTDIDNYIELVKPLKKRGEYIQFINVCKKLYILGEDNIFIDHNFAYIFRGLGYTSKEILEMEKQQA